MYNDDKTINVNLIIDIQGEDEVRNREREKKNMFIFSIQFLVLIHYPVSLFYKLK